TEEKSLPEETRAAVLAQLLTHALNHRQGIYLDQQNRAHESALSLAVSQGREDVVGYLISANVVVAGHCQSWNALGNNDPLGIAIQARSVDIIKTLCTVGKHTYSTYHFTSLAKIADTKIRRDLFFVLLKNIRKFAPALTKHYCENFFRE